MCSDGEFVEELLPERFVENLRGYLLRLLEVPGFREFALSHRGTIKRELKRQSSLEDLLDVVAELECAALIVQEDVALNYQVKVPESEKVIDFHATFASTTPVGLEVKRIRETPEVLAKRGQGVYQIPYKQTESFKFSDHILKALPQLYPGIANVVFVMTDSTTHEHEDGLQALKHLMWRYQDGDEKYFEKNGYDSLDDFRNQFLKLSLLVVRTRWVGGGECRNYIVGNRDAQIELPNDVVEFIRDVDF